MDRHDSGGQREVKPVRHYRILSNRQDIACSINTSNATLYLYTINSFFFWVVLSYIQPVDAMIRARRPLFRPPYAIQVHHRLHHLAHLFRRDRRLLALLRIPPERMQEPAPLHAGGRHRRRPEEGGGGVQELAEARTRDRPARGVGRGRAGGGEGVQRGAEREFEGFLHR